MRLVASVLAVVAGLGAWGAVGGFAVGAVAVLAVSLTPASGPFRGIAWRDVRAALADRPRWAETGGVAGTQAVLSALAAADAVVVAVLVTAPGDAAAAAGYQAVSTLAKAPVYVAVGTALVSFPVLRVATGTGRDLRLREALGSYVRLLVPAAAVVATVPTALVGLVLPAQYLPAVAPAARPRRHGGRAGDDDGARDPAARRPRPRGARRRARRGRRPRWPSGSPSARPGPSRGSRACPPGRPGDSPRAPRSGRSSARCWSPCSAPPTGRVAWAPSRVWCAPGRAEPATRSSSWRCSPRPACCRGRCRSSAGWSRSA